jgi:hypothetical protein
MAKPGSARPHQCGRNSKLKKRYGITLDEYADILAEQNGVCAICGYAPSSTDKALAVDHNHITKKVRGLLCSWCNRGLGLFKDSPYLLEVAYTYLTERGYAGKLKRSRWRKLK